MAFLSEDRAAGMDTFLMGNVSVQGRDINGSNDGCVGDLVLDVFQLP